MTEPNDQSARLVRNPHLVVVQCTEDEVLVRHGARSRYSRVLRDDGRNRALGPLLRAFERPVGPDDVANRLADRITREQFDQLVAQLSDDGVLVKEGSGTFSLYRGVAGGKPIEGLGAATVGVIGLGQIGAQVAAQLTELGVGGVEALAAGDGKPAAAAWSAHLNGSAGAVPVRPGSVDDDPDTVGAIVDDTDVVVLALEGFRPALLHRVNRVAVAAGRPWLPVYADGSEMIVGPLVVPGESACYNEHEIQHESSRVLRREYLLYSEEQAGQSAGGLPALLPPFAAIAASWAVVALIPFLADGASFLVGRAIRIDFERLEITQEHVLRLPRCPVCSPHRPAFRHPFL
ncbi:TOMM precursor leader peptide-binding protein [Frankia sp. CNm7]|uniref:TOMM leader peptide-binding protein n=1 Tax=Frankia nepalensis TaxID=1836974 RepID=A0A937REV0_9ACTN|nr:TOMM precursor leader peptide-binding protein [Frankia nepalensis]MBL7500335.1 TOMM precursor leader peptide-binding protein [Frankia nepalensis]MBL7508557.1 TOMM precursor leader peptide-binding protein [Frankia nepalensis]MBL7524214.1 TOMM precursor leader peptide-binding protein [Frankia nepalensis]MBL7627685.1 TOMM precursor leader peptide-binding protein [Frankia nepalensis]